LTISAIYKVAICVFSVSSEFSPMKFSYRWLRELVPGLNTDPAGLQRLITMKTAECEGVDPVGTHFASVVAALIVSVSPLSKGKNNLVVADIGGGKLVKVVCGAANVRPGLLAPWVPPGTRLGEKLIGRTTIEGAESEGMLASAAELGVGRDHSGLLELDAALKPGDLLSGLLPDFIIEIDNKSLTHRPDLWGHYGMAREVAAITGFELSDPVKPDLLPGGASPLKVEIADYALCPRYSALVFENVHVGPSPLWLQARLEHLGVNTINNIVDVTNLIMLELPQPAHAYDADKLTGDTIFVRPANVDEALAALNGETYTLTPADLVIADAAGSIGLAGVIGGAASAISSATSRIVFEAANFEPSNLRLTSVRYKLRTDASMRFEKSLDPENTIRAVARAVELLREVSPGIRLVGGVVDNRGPLPQTKIIDMSMSFLIRKLGKDVPQPEVTGILTALGFRVIEPVPAVLSVLVPTWRATKDISLKDDLVEEIGRMVGYDSITPTPPLVAATVPPDNPLSIYLRQLRAQLTAQGFTEAHNYSFLTETDIKRFAGDPNSHIAIQNPIASELTHMRRSLLPGLFKSILANVRFFPEFRLFEIGNEIHPSAVPDLPREVTHLAAVFYSAHGEDREFYELKRVLECVFPGARLRTAEPQAFEHPVRTAEIFWSEGLIGRIFELHPSLLRAEGLDGRVMVFDVDVDMALALASTRVSKYMPLRKFPTSGFDLSVVADSFAPVAKIQDQLTRLAGPDLALIEFVRQYAGPQLPHGQKSVSYHLKVGALDHTMTADELTTIRRRIIEGMQGLGYELRGLD
jgi:phenylalanyl-tRNA synthetase beta chain